MLFSQTWTTRLRQSLRKTALQTDANLVVDRNSRDYPDLLIKREGGGFDRIFGAELRPVLGASNGMIWESEVA